MLEFPAMADGGTGEVSDGSSSAVILQNTNTNCAAGTK